MYYLCVPTYEYHSVVSQNVYVRYLETYFQKKGLSIGISSRHKAKGPGFYNPSLILLNKAIALKIHNASMHELRSIHTATRLMLYELIVCTSLCRENKPQTNCHKLVQLVNQLANGCNIEYPKTPTMACPGLYFPRLSRSHSLAKTLLCRYNCHLYHHTTAEARQINMIVYANPLSSFMAMNMC